jgi:glycosyltransferase involved in cell wall biosynthesis
VTGIMRFECQHGIDGRPPRSTSNPAVELRGWCFLPADSVAPALRVRIRTFRGSRVLETFERTERPDVLLSQARAPLRCGFHFCVPLSFGVNLVKLEAQAAAGWTLLRRTLVWRTPRLTAWRTLPWRRPHQVEAWPSDVPLVTVVIPCHNQGRNAMEALESVLHQTFSRTEVIIVDDGSDDPVTIAILEGVGNAAVLQQSCRNAADARNMAVRRARGKWICCLDPEERLAPTFLEKCLFLLETEGFDLCGSLQQTSRYRDAAPDPRPFGPQRLLDENCRVAAGIYRKKLWIRVGGYDPPIEPGSEDREFWNRLVKTGARATFVPKPLFRQAGSRRRRPAGYDNLLHSPLSSAARPPCTILLAMPFLTIGGAEASMRRICAHLSRLEFRFVVVTTVAAGPEHGDSTAWFENCTSEIFHLPQFLGESRWPDFLDYLIESRRIRLLWQVGSTYTYDQLPRIKQRFAELRVLDLLFNPVGHGASFLKYNCFIDHVVAEHRGMEEWLLGNGWSGEKITVIPNGIDLELFQPATNSCGRGAEGPAKRDETKFVVGFFGRLSEEKGPDVFIEIATQLRDREDIEFAIAGGGPLEEKIRKSIAGRLLHNVRFLGFVDAREYLPCCDVLVVCSRLDGRPNAVMEAQAMGVPVIASRVGGLPEMVAEGRTGLLVDSEDVQGFVRAIMDLSGDRGRCEQMRQSARSWAEQHFSLRDSIDHYARLLRDLTRRENQRPHEALSGIGVR